MIKRKENPGKFDKLVSRATEGVIGELFQRDLMDRVEQYRLRNFRLLRLSIVLIVFLVLVLDLSSWIILLLHLPDSSVYALYLFMIVFLIGVVHLFKKQVEERMARKFLSNQLNQKSVRPNFCLTCHYELRGSDSPACPECGAAIAPSKQ